MRLSFSGRLGASAAAPAQMVSQMRLAHLKRLRVPAGELSAKMVRQARRTASMPTALRTGVRRAVRRVAAGESPIAHDSTCFELRWAPEYTNKYRISADGRRLVRVAGMDAWAVGSLLPVTGTCSFRVRVDQRSGRAGRCCIGVCDAGGSLAYGLHVQSGLLMLWTRDSTGKVRSGEREAPLPGWPTRVNTRVCPPSEGMVGDAHGDEAGVISCECFLDLNQGLLGFCVNGGPSRQALSGLPLGCALRPWARVVHADDELKLEPGTDMGRQRRLNRASCMPLDHHCDARPQLQRV